MAAGGPGSTSIGQSDKQMVLERNMELENPQFDPELHPALDVEQILWLDQSVLKRGKQGKLDL